MSALTKERALEIYHDVIAMLDGRGDESPIDKDDISLHLLAVNLLTKGCGHTVISGVVKEKVDRLLEFGHPHDDIIRKIDALKRPHPAPATTFRRSRETAMRNAFERAMAARDKQG
jgi:hypothetical protein